MEQPKVMDNTRNLTAYSPGLHLLVEMKGIRSGHLKDYRITKSLIDEMIDLLELNALGSVYHNFEEGGFTAIVCLTESHLSIHSWPEFGVVTADVFLSNYRNDNSEKARGIMNSIIELYQCTDYHISEMFR